MRPRTCSDGALSLTSPAVTASAPFTRTAAAGSLGGRSAEGIRTEHPHRGVAQFRRADPDAVPVG